MMCMNFQLEKLILQAPRPWNSVSSDLGHSSYYSINGASPFLSMTEATSINVGRYGPLQTGTCERGGNAVLGDGSRDGIDDHCATRRASQLTKPTLNPLLQPWGLWDLEKLENKAAAKMETTQVMLAIKNTCDRPAVQQAANLFAWFALCSIFQTWDGEGALPAILSHL